MVPLNSEKSIQLHVNDVYVLVRISSRKKLPTKVSVTCYFPPFPGRNDPVPTVEDQVNFVKKSFNAVEKNDNECGLLQETMNNIPGCSNNNNGVIVKD